MLFRSAVEMLCACVSADESVIASTGRLTWNPSSCADRAVDSTPLPVAIPVTTTWVTPSSLRCTARSVLWNAPQVYLMDGAGSEGQLVGVLARRVRSATESATSTTLTPIMIQAMRWTPLLVTLVWKTTPVMAEDASEPT